MEPPFPSSGTPGKVTGANHAGIHIPLLLMCALVCLVVGLVTPIMEVRNLWVFHGAYSIVDGVLILIDQGDLVIAAILAAFSILLPIGKILVLMVLWRRLRLGVPKSSRLPALLETIGKWSMLDVFVVALVVVIAKTSFVADASFGSAIGPFIAAIVLTVYCARIVRQGFDASTAFRT